MLGNTIQFVPKTIVEIKNLVKRYNKAKVNAVDDISFDVKEGEFFALLGPNGAGKTTTISILTTTLAKTGGTINVAGYDLDRESSKVRQNIGIIFQKPSLDLNLTAEENIRFHSTLYGLFPYRASYSLMPKVYRERVQELAKIIGIQGELFKQVKTFSGGMKRKLEVIRSLMHKPKVLFLDEPTSGLDPLSRKNLWEYLKKIREEEKTTVFLTTHYLDEAEEADRVCIIGGGKIVTMGTPEKIKKDLVKQFVTMDAKDRNKLEKEFKTKGIKYEGEGPFKIIIPTGNAQKVIKSINTELNYLDIHNPTLEDAYIEIVEKESKDKEGDASAK